MDPVIKVYLYELAGAALVILLAGLFYLFMTGNPPKGDDDGD